MDVWLTWLYMKYASDLADGVSDLARADPAWKIDSESFDPLDASRARAAATTGSAESLSELTPRAPSTARSSKRSTDYREQAARGGWPTVPATIEAQTRTGESVRGRAVARPRRLRRLHGAGPAPANRRSTRPNSRKRSSDFSAGTDSTDDGVVGPRGRGGDERAGRGAHPADRVEHGAVAMAAARARRSATSSSTFRKCGSTSGTTARDPLTMRVVVGKPDTPTPIFNERMTYLVFAPFWNVPADIAEERNAAVGAQRPGVPEPHEHGGRRSPRAIPSIARRSICRARTSIASVSGRAPRTRSGW